MKKVWALDPHDSSLPEGLEDEIFNEIQAGIMPNGSLEIVSIDLLKDRLVDPYDKDSYSCPLLIKYLESQGLDSDEKVYIHIWW